MENIKVYKNINNGSVVLLMNNITSNDFIEIKANTTDAAVEKHVPVYEKNGDNIVVSIGETLHPMEENHYIEWIAYVYGSRIEIVNLKPGEEPKATFKFVSGATIFAYCNIHGLWKSTIL